MIDCYQRRVDIGRGRANNSQSGVVSLTMDNGQH